MARPLSRLTNITSHLRFSTSARVTARSPAMESKLSPLTGLYQPNNLNAMYYGPGTVKAHLLACLPSESSKAFIITGSSLASKTPLVKQVEELLGSKHHAGTFSKIGQHAPIKELDEATDKVKEDSSIDTIISIGGGSPIDSAKAISYRVHEKTDKFLTHIAIPTSKDFPFYVRILLLLNCHVVSSRTRAGECSCAHQQGHTRRKTLSQIFLTPGFGVISRSTLSCDSYDHVPSTRNT